MLQRIIRAVLALVAVQPLNVENEVMNLVCRVRHKDAHFLKVLTQSSVHSTNCEGRMVSSFTLLTDISFLEHCHSVEWNFESDYLNKELLKTHIDTASIDSLLNGKNRL